MNRIVEYAERTVKRSIEGLIEAISHRPHSDWIAAPKKMWWTAASNMRMTSWWIAAPKTRINMMMKMKT